MADALIARFRKLTHLTQDELDAVGALTLDVQKFGPREDIVKEGERLARCFIVLDGLACSYKSTNLGQRQISAFHIAGDMPDLHSLHLRTIDTSIAAISPCTIGFVRHDALHALCAKSYKIAAALWRMTLIDGSIFREWETNLGQREALVAMRHLLCEQFTRLSAMGLAQGNSFSFPVTQQELGDALGLSTVHVNRTLQKLRGDGLIQFEQGEVEVHDWPSFMRAADFDPAYLHLTPDGGLRDESPSRT